MPKSINQEIIALRKKGLTLHQIKDKLGLKLHQVYKVLRPSKPKVKKNQLILSIESGLKNGKTRKQLAIELELSLSYVYQLCPMKISKGQRAYELRYDSKMRWPVIAQKLGYATGSTAKRAAKKYSKAKQLPFYDGHLRAPTVLGRPEEAAKLRADGKT